MPLLNDPNHAGMIAMMGRLRPLVADSAAFIVVTAHWEEYRVTLSGGPNPGMLYDYYGFPPETYEICYPAPGTPDLAAEAQEMLAAAGIDAGLDTERGYDHGTFVPMIMLREEADIPVLQVSLLASLDPALHMAAGRALAGLMRPGVTMIGSGLSFHNMDAFRARSGEGADQAKAFDDWLNDTLLGADTKEADRAAALSNWAEAPGARFSHPREEHLLPLHVCCGAASAAGLQGENIFREDMFGYAVSGFRWAAS